MKELVQSDIDFLIRAVANDYVIYKIEGLNLITLAYSPNIPSHSGLSKSEYDEMVGSDAKRIVWENDLPYVVEHLGKCLQGEDVSLTYRIKHKTKGFVWIHAIARLVGTLDGAPITLATFLAVSDESELYLSLLDHSNTMIFVSDRHTRELLYANRVAVDNSAAGACDTRSTTCYEFFSGLDKVCPWCTIDSMQEDETKDIAIYRSGNGQWLRGSTQLIKWGGHEAAVHYLVDVTELQKAAAELQRSRQIYETALENAQLFVFEYDVPNQKITMMNNPFTEQTRLKFHLPETLEDAPEAAKQYLGADTDKVLNLYKRAANGLLASCEIYLENNPCGASKWLRVTMCALDPGTGKTYATIQDCTVQRIAFERYNSIIDYFMKVNDNCLGIARLNLTQDTAMIVRNPQLPQLTVECGKRYPVDEFFRRNAEFIIDKSEAEKHLRIFNRQALLDAHLKLQNFHTHRCRIAFGTGCIIADTRLQIIVSPWNGDVEAMLYMENVDGRVKKEKLLQKITDFDYDYLCLLDVEKQEINIYSLSSALPENYHDIFRIGKTYPYSVVCANAARCWVHPDDADMLAGNCSIRNILLQLSVSDVYEYTLRGVRKDDSVCYKRLRYSWLDNAKNTILIEQTDVTALYMEQQHRIMKEQRLREAATTANRLKTEFLSSVSHDMRTPLNAILGYADMALQDEVADKCRSYLNKIKMSGEILKNLVNETLDLNRIEGKKILLRESPLRLSVFADKIRASVSLSVKDKGLSFEFNSSGAADQYVLADEERLSLILMNILSNAVKYTPGGGKVTFAMSCKDEGGDALCCTFVVSDTGIGISSEFLPRVFEPFSQERDETSIEGGGAGLGLAVVKSLVELMGGTVTMESTRGQGAKVTVQLTFRLVMPEETAPAKKAPAATLRGRNILVCEDNEMNSEIVKHMLETAGMNVVCASNGQAGVDEYLNSEARGFDAILMDIRMPVVNGYEAAKSIRNSGRADARTIPIIALSADAYDANVERAAAAGMNRHIAKPFAPEQLYEALTELIC